MRRNSQEEKPKQEIALGDLVGIINERRHPADIGRRTLR